MELSLTLNVKKVKLFKTAGVFIYCYDNDAYILNYLLSYKIINGRCGFPSNALKKVVDCLTDNKISYIIYEKNNVIDNKDFEQKNKYLDIYNIAIEHYGILERINLINKKIGLMDINKLKGLIGIIDEYISQ